jgi:hypothetical protein
MRPSFLRVEPWRVQRVLAAVHHEQEPLQAGECVGALMSSLSKQNGSSIAQHVGDRHARPDPAADGPCRQRRERDVGAPGRQLHIGHGRCVRSTGRAQQHWCWGAHVQPHDGSCLAAITGIRSPVPHLCLLSSRIRGAHPPWRNSPSAGRAEPICMAAAPTRLTARAAPNRGFCAGLPRAETGVPDRAPQGEPSPGGVYGTLLSGHGLPSARFPWSGVPPTRRSRS